MARKYHRIISTLAVGGLLAAFAPGAYAASATELGTKYETLDESLWSCVWNDEFDGSSVDTTKWSYTVGGGGFGNNEQQYYTDFCQQLLYTRWMSCNRSAAGKQRR